MPSVTWPPLDLIRSLCVDEEIPNLCANTGCHRCGDGAFLILYTAGGPPLTTEEIPLLYSLSSSTQSEEEHGRTPLRTRTRPDCHKSLLRLLDEAED